MWKKGSLIYPQELGEEVGQTRALVLAAVWSYSLMPEGYCFASMASIAERLVVSTITVRRAVGWLEQEGYLTREHRGVHQTDILTCSDEITEHFNEYRNKR